MDQTQMDQTMFHFSIAKYLRFVLCNHPAAFRLHVTQKKHMTSRVIMSDFWGEGVLCFLWLHRAGWVQHTKQTHWINAVNEGENIFVTLEQRLHEMSVTFNLMKNVLMVLKLKNKSGQGVCGKVLSVFRVWEVPTVWMFDIHHSTLWVISCKRLHPSLCMSH